MPPRARRFVATVAVVFFLIFWIWGAVTLHALLPKAWPFSSSCPSWR